MTRTSPTAEHVYDIHVSVSGAPDPEQFSAVCRQLGVKPIMLHLLSSHSDWLDTDNMSSSVFKGTDLQAQAETDRIANGLASAGFTVIRKKIESTPWHPLAQQHGLPGSTLSPERYFECHLNFLLKDNADLESLMKFAQCHRLHLSQNLFKRREDGSCVVMATLREYADTLDVFKHKVSEIQHAATIQSFQVEKQVIEFAIFDTKTDHDDAWLTA